MQSFIHHSKRLLVLSGFLAALGAHSSEPTRYCGKVEGLSIESAVDPIRPELTLDVDYSLQLSKDDIAWTVDVRDPRAVVRAYAAMTEQPQYFHDGTPAKDVSFVPVQDRFDLCVVGNYAPNSSTGGFVTRAYQLEIWKNGAKILDNARFDP
jgi:hypothetical protein